MQSTPMPKARKVSKRGPKPRTRPRRQLAVAPGVTASSKPAAVSHPINSQKSSGSQRPPTMDKTASPRKIASVNARQKARMAVSACARTKPLQKEDATIPAPSAKIREASCTNPLRTRSQRLTPPSIRGITTTGMTAAHRVKALRPCTNALARTTSRGRSGVRASKGRVPSRRSRLSESDPIKGTSTQIAPRSNWCS